MQDVLWVDQVRVRLGDKVPVTEQLVVTSLEVGNVVDTYCVRKDRSLTVVSRYDSASRPTLRHAEPTNPDLERHAHADVPQRAVA